MKNRFLSSPLLVFVLGQPLLSKCSPEKEARNRDGHDHDCRCHDDEEAEHVEQVELIPRQVVYRGPE
jgi:hypothetical protein